MSYDSEIKKKDLENILISQISAKHRAETEILKAKASIEKYDETVKDLDEKINTTKEELKGAGVDLENLKSLF